MGCRISRVTERRSETQMNWDAVGAIAEVAGVLGIVISLVYVGVQVRQNTMQLRQDNLRETMRGTLDNYWYFHRDDAAFEVFVWVVKASRNWSQEIKLTFTR